MPAHTNVLDQGRDTVRIWVWMTGLSILCHILLFFGVISLPELRFAGMHIPSAVEVDLVSLPKAAFGPKAGPGQVSPPRVELKREPVKPVKPAEQPEPPKPAKALEAAKQKEAFDKAVSMAPKPVQVKRSLKQKTFDASKVIKGAIAKIEKEVPKSRPRPVLQAVDKLKEEVESHLGVVLREGTAGGRASKKTLELLDIYNVEIWHLIQKNWAFSEEMVRGRIDLEATIIVKIMRKGEIRDIWFEKRSGNSYFDDSVFKAVRKSDPLPPLPEGYPGPFYEVGFRFNLSELQRRF